MCLIGLGILLRAAEFLEGRSLWLDETLLSLNVLERSWGGLLQPLDYQQGAPIGFLLLQKAAVTLAGPSEYALRLVPFLAGIGTLLFGWLLARRWLGPEGGLVALGLLAVCDPLVSYSAEAKQYGLDTLASVVLLWAATRVLQERRRNDLVLLACLGSVLIWFSHPSVFVLAGVFAMLVVRAVRDSDRGAILGLAAVASGWTASFLLCEALSLRRLAVNRFFLEFWAPSFVPPVAELPWFANRLAGKFAAFLDVSPSPPLLLVWFGVGVIACAALRLPFAVAAFVPLLAAGCASAASLYPLSERLLMFLVPIALFVLAEGLDFVRRLAGRRLPGAGALVLAAAFVFPAWQSLHELRSPRVIQDFKPLFEELRGRARPDDWIYVSHLASYPWHYYAGRYGFNGDIEVPRDYADPQRVLEPTERRLFQAPGRNPILVGTVSHFTSDRGRDVIRDLQPLFGRPRVWIVIAHGGGGRNAGRSILAYLDRVGRRLEQVRRPGLWGGCEAALYDLGGAVAAAAAADAIPDDAGALWRAADAALRAGDSERSLRLFARLEAIVTLGDQALFEKGQAQQLYGDDEGAVTTYRALLADDPDDLRARAFLGDALVSLDRCAEATTELRRVLQARPDLDRPHEILARCRARAPGS